MVKLTRWTMPVFAGSAAQEQTSVFGTMKTSPEYTSDVAAAIDTQAYADGWFEAIEIGYAPFVEDMNSLQRAITYQISYNQQQGIPEWASDTEYYKGSVVKLNTASGMQIYSSLVDSNVGNLVSDNTKWKLLIDSADSYVTTNTAQTISSAKTFSTSPLVPTATSGDNSTKAASTAFVANVASGLQTSINTKANDSNVVHKTGNETVGGVKTFNNAIHFKSSVFVDDASGDEGGEIEFAKAPNSSLLGNVKLDVYRNSMRIFGSASNGQTNNVINADIEQNAVFVPSSDKINAAISTVGINKNQNGYVKLGNGIIIQWGTLSSGKTITYSTAFTNADSYALVFNNNSTTDGYGRGDKIESKSSTSATVNGSCENPIRWLAIGY